MSPSFPRQNSTRRSLSAASLSQRGGRACHHRLRAVSADGANAAWRCLTCKLRRLRWSLDLPWRLTRSRTYGCRTLLHGSCSRRRAHERCSRRLLGECVKLTRHRQFVDRLATRRPLSYSMHTSRDEHRQLPCAACRVRTIGHRVPASADKRRARELKSSQVR